MRSPPPPLFANTLPPCSRLWRNSLAREGKRQLGRALRRWLRVCIEAATCAKRIERREAWRYAPFVYVVSPAANRLSRAHTFAMESQLFPRHAYTHARTHADSFSSPSPEIGVRGGRSPCATRRRAPKKRPVVRQVQPSGPGQVGSLRPSEILKYRTGMLSGETVASREHSSVFASVWGLSRKRRFVALDAERSSIRR